MLQDFNRSQTQSTRFSRHHNANNRAGRVLWDVLYVSVLPVKVNNVNNPGGVRHDPQRFMGKTVTVPHFNCDTVEFASRKRTQGSKH